MRKLLICFLLTISTISMAAYSQQLAFPSAEGYGKYTVGGRAGKVYEVTNLNDSGEGSLRAAVEAEGPRTVVFRVSGNIPLQKPLRIRHPYITIAGQTAPGDGICLQHQPLLIETNEVIIRHLRIRLGAESAADNDAVAARGCRNIILDHLSASWSIDETMSVYECEDITVQWCMITESLFAGGHIKGNHGFGGIWGGNHATFHHNLIAHHSSRNPRWAGGVGQNDYRNNVIYNWGYNSCYGGEGTDRHGKGAFEVNMVGNYYKAGPATAPGNTRHRIANPSYKTNAIGKWYIAGNYVEGYPDISADNWKGGVVAEKGVDASIYKKAEAWPSMPIAAHSAQQAYDYVLHKAGATLPKRDAVDSRIVEEVRQGTATFDGRKYKELKTVANKSIACGIIDSPSDVGGWPVLATTEAPLDTDHDGLPDEWEEHEGLDPYNSSDGADVAVDGYTNLEHYLNHLAGE